MEIWKTIEDYPNYQVSNLGRIKSLCWGKERILKQTLNKGYWTVTLKHDGKQTCGKVYRLMAIAFLPNPDNLPQVDHINRNRADNRLENLRWVSHSLNMLNRDSYCSSNSGHRHITIMKNNRYHVHISRNSVKFQKNFKLLQDAIAWRDETLKILSDKEEDGGNQGNILFEEQTPTTRVGEGIPEKE